MLQRITEKIKRQAYSNWLKIVVLSALPYLLFFNLLLNPNDHLAGKDLYTFTFPSRYYLWENLKNLDFPFYTEKIYSGFPIYADPERGFLNPLNIATIAMLGPFQSLKLLHFAFYLAGSFSLYLLLKAKYQNVVPLWFLSNIIYFFNISMLFHQQHFSMTLTLYSIPTLVFLFTKTFASKTKLSTFLTALFLSNLLYFGSFQSVFISLICSFLYLTVFEELNLLVVVKKMALTALVSVTLTLPLLIPAFNLYKTSYRDNGTVDFKQGNYYPVMLTNLFIPYLLGKTDNYFFLQISNDFLIHETYNYISLTLAVLLFFSNNVLAKKSKIYLLISFYLFYLLTFGKFVPLFNYLPLPLFDFFRYWGRSVFILLFGIAVILPEIVSKIEQVKPVTSAKNMLLSLALVLILTVLSPKTYTILQVFKGAYRIAIVNYLVALGCLLGTITAFYLVKQTKNMRFFKFFLVIFITVDLWFQGYPIINGYVRSIGQIVPPNLEKFETSEKTRIYAPELNWNLGLYTKAYGILGYSQFIQSKYLPYIQANVKGGDKKYSLDSDVLAMEKAFNLNQRLPDSFNEGDVKLNVIANESKEANTFVQYYKNWAVTVNQKPQKPILSDTDPFIHLKLEKGENQIKMKYIPKDFYFGVGLMLLLTPILLITPKKLYE